MGTRSPRAHARLTLRTSVITLIFLVLFSWTESCDAVSLFTYGTPSLSSLSFLLLPFVAHIPHVAASDYYEILGVPRDATLRVSFMGVMFPHPSSVSL